MKKLDPKVFGQRLREARLSKGWTQQALAEALGVTREAIAIWEGGGTPTMKNACALANVLHVTIDSLVTP